MKNLRNIYAAATAAPGNLATYVIEHPVSQVMTVFAAAAVGGLAGSRNGQVALTAFTASLGAFAGAGLGMFGGVLSSGSSDQNSRLFRVATGATLGYAAGIAEGIMLCLGMN